MTLQEHIDALEAMVAQGAPKPKIRSQVTFIGLEVAALEARYASLLDAHTLLQDEHAKLQAAQPQPPPQQVFFGSKPPVGGRH
jgi:hypothetical protein